MAVESEGKRVLHGGEEEEEVMIRKDERKEDEVN